MNVSPDIIELIKAAAGFLVTLCSSAVTAIVVLWRANNWLNAEFKKRDEEIVLANQRARAAEDVLAGTIGDLRVHIAEHYATKDSIAEAIDKLDRSVSDVRDLLNQLLIRAAGSTGPQPRSRGGG